MHVAQPVPHDATQYENSIPHRGTHACYSERSKERPTRSCEHTHVSTPSLR